VKGGRGERKMVTESRKREKIAQKINQYKSFIHALPLFISSIDHFASPRCDAMGTERAV